MNLIRSIRKALANALQPDAAPTPSVLQIVAAEKLNCDLSLLDALAESERWNFTVEMLQERQSRLGETLEFEREAAKRTSPGRVWSQPAPHYDERASGKVEGFGEPRVSGDKP